MNKNKLLASAMAVALTALSTNAVADATQDLIDALVTKGVLSPNEAEILAEQHKAEAKSEGRVTNKLGLESADGKKTIKISGRVQMDWRDFDMDTTANEDASDGGNFDIRRAYLGVSGKYDYIKYKFNGSFGSSTKLDVAQLSLSYYKPLQIVFGQFKTSMSLEERTSSRFLNFTERSYVNNYAFTSAKDVGFSIYGTPTKGFNYAYAMVNGYGQNTDTPDGNDTYAHIFHADVDLATMNKWKNQVAHLGVNYRMHDTEDNGLAQDLEQRTLGRGYKFFTATLDSGAGDLEMKTMGLEAAYATGSFKVQGEFATTEFDTTAETQDIDAYYVDVGWLLTGEKYSKAYKSKSMGGKFDRIKPNSNFNPETGKGIGAWELMAGYNKFDASEIKVASTGIATSSGKANESDSWRVGVKWVLDPQTRIMLSYIDTDFDYEAGQTGDKDEQAINIRTQFDF